MIEIQYSICVLDISVSNASRETIIISFRVFLSLSLPHVVHTNVLWTVFVSRENTALATVLYCVSISYGKSLYVNEAYNDKFRLDLMGYWIVHNKRMDKYERHVLNRPMIFYNEIHTCYIINIFYHVIIIRYIRVHRLIVCTKSVVCLYIVRFAVHEMVLLLLWSCNMWIRRHSFVAFKTQKFAQTRTCMDTRNNARLYI